MNIHQLHDFRYPLSMAPPVRRIMEGEYDVAYEHPAPVILDIGANVGAFALWALQRWPGSFVHCYEPHPETFETLTHNLLPIFEGRVALHPYAIGDPAWKKLRLGKHNCGEASFFDLGEQREDFIEVKTKRPYEIASRANVLKIDAEGAEGVILRCLFVRPVGYHAILFEYHSDALRRHCDALLEDYILVGASNVHNFSIGQRGTLKYLHKRLMEK